MINLIDPVRARYQNKGSNQCGQACVATVLDIHLEEAVKLVGKKGCTSSKDLRKALAQRHINLGKRLHPKHQQKGVPYLAIVHWPTGHRTHWVAIDLDDAQTIFDPVWGFNPHQEGGWPEGSRITSLYPLHLLPGFTK